MIVPLGLLFASAWGVWAGVVPGEGCGVTKPIEIYRSIKPEDLPLPECSVVLDNHSFHSVYIGNKKGGETLNGCNF